MNQLIKTIGILALTAVVNAGSVSAATEYRNPHLDIIDTVRAAGYEVRTEHGFCTEVPTAQGFVYTPESLFVICVKNISNSIDGYNTIRHEAIHVGQHCREGLMFPISRAHVVKRATDNGWDPSTYPAEQRTIEAEARVYADILSAEEVVHHVSIACDL